MKSSPIVSARVSSIWEERLFLSRGVKNSEPRVKSKLLKSRSRWVLKNRVKRILAPLLRPYVRYAPFSAGKDFLWRRVLEHHIAWSSKPFVARTVFGSRLAGDTQDLIQCYIYYFGVWEPNLTRWMSERLSPGDTFIDVGANIGYFSLLASQLVRETGAVVAIEASPATFRALQDNLARNRARNVRAINRAVFDRKTVLKLYRGREDNIGETTILETPDFAVECEVEAEPLSAMLQPEEIAKARLVKIDVEGAAWQVVAGIGPLLHFGRADLEVVVEIDPQPLAALGKRPEDLLQIFQAAGFNAYSLENIYEGSSYLPGYTLKRPVRFHGPVDKPTDFVFSRQDSESL